jgi:hypothetical protein
VHDQAIPSLQTRARSPVQRRKLLSGVINQYDPRSLAGAVTVGAVTATKCIGTSDLQRAAVTAGASKPSPTASS